MKKRTTLIVLGDFQKWFLLSFTFYTLAFLCVLAGGLYAYFHVVANNLKKVGGLLSETQLSLINDHLFLGMWILIGLVTATTVVAGMYALVFSRRIAGPIFAFSRHLDRCLETKELKPMKLRDNDLFQDLAERFNRVVEVVGSKRR